MLFIKKKGKQEIAQFHGGRINCSHKFASACAEAQLGCCVSEPRMCRNRCYVLFLEGSWIYARQVLWIERVDV
jgi:hypothetical protein